MIVPCRVQVHRCDNLQTHSAQCYAGSVRVYRVLLLDDRDRRSCRMAPHMETRSLGTADDTHSSDAAGSGLVRPVVPFPSTHTHHVQCSVCCCARKTHTRLEQTRTHGSTHTVHCNVHAYVHSQLINTASHGGYTSLAHGVVSVSWRVGAGELSRTTVVLCAASQALPTALALWWALSTLVEDMRRTQAAFV